MAPGSTVLPAAAQEKNPRRRTSSFSSLVEELIGFDVNATSERWK